MVNHHTNTFIRELSEYVSVVVNKKYMAVYPGVHGDLYQEQNENLLESQPLQQNQEKGWKREFEKQKFQEKNASISRVAQKQATGAVLWAGGEGVQATGAATQTAGRGISAGGRALMRGGAALSETGAGAIVGIPLAIAGAGALIGGKLIQGSGSVVQKGGQTMQKTGEGIKKSAAKGVQEDFVALAKKLLIQKLKWWILTAVGGFIVSILPYILIILLVLFIIMIFIGFIGEVCTAMPGINKICDVVKSII